MTVHFEEAGPHNTDQTLETAQKAARERNIKHILVASTWGDTGVKAAKVFSDNPARVTIVSHNTGFNEEGVQQLEPDKAEQIKKLGGQIYTGTMVLRGLGTAVRQRSGNYSEEQLIANTLRILGQGIKVCVEISAMACDAGLVPPGDVIAIAGTGRGADTCAVIAANSSNRFFDIKVREILAKPSNF
ncbi:MAG TPA: pyruvate kinase alpha/beta domain-containing protein [bacterium]|nr:pyruvate kinase alpha/beta domain-containing protein [bacterium]